MSSLFDQTQSLSTPPPSRKAIYLFPALVILGILVLIGSSMDQLWGTVPEVEVSRVRIGTASSSTIPKNETLFRAAGWLRAGPYPTLITGLAGGIVKKVHVVEGDLVEKGQLIAQLDDEDSRLQLKQSLQELTVAKKESMIQKAHINILKNSGEELEALAKRINVSLEGLQKDHLRLTSSGPGISLREVEQALYRMKEKEVELKVLGKRLATLASKQQQSNIEWLKSKEVVKLKEVQVEKDRLALSRMEIRSPSQGMIKDLYARVGRKQLLGADNPLSTTVATIYNPKILFVRVDVPLMDAFKVMKGLRANVEVEGLGQSLKGEVTHISGEADEQKNTLGVRVQLENPHMRLRPGMLAQVVFISSGTAAGSKSTSSQTHLLLHPKALQGERVAVVNEEGVLKWKDIQLQQGEENGWLILKSGLGAGEKTVLEPNSQWSDGQRLSFGAES